MKSTLAQLKIFVTICLLFFSTIAYEQTLNGISRNIVKPSPDAASFTKYGNIPVGTYTGVPDLNIPLYNIEARDLSMPISLSYHSSGIQVAEESGWTGIGWNLQVGGMITREIRGLDDLKTVVRGGSGIPFAAFSYSGYPFDPAIPTTTPVPGDYVTKVCRKEVDPEPDIFYYNFMGESGSFILPKQSQSYSEIIGSPLTPDKIKITFDKNIKKWIIKTKDGTTFYFSVSEIQEIRRYEQPSMFGVQPCQNYFAETSMLNNEGYYYNGEDINVTAWYLEKIVSATGETISFTYDLFTPSGEPETKKLSRYGSTTITFSDIASKNFNVQVQGTGTTCVPQCSETKIRDFYRTFTAHIYLKEILFRNGKIEFNISDRSDMRAANTSGVLPYNGLLKQSIGSSVSKGPQKLDNIVIKDFNGNLVKKIGFEYSYFNDNATTDVYTIKRLKLLRVKELANDGTTALPPYEFLYDEQNPLPAKYSRAIDFWGYYNGVQTNASRVPKGTYTPSGSSPVVVGDANRNPNGTYMTSGIIKEIKYPTGGRSVFEFEPHDYYYYGTGVFDLTENLPTGIPVNGNGIYAKQAGGLRIKRIIDFDSFGDTASQKSYKYISEDGTKSSGRLMLFPSFHTLEGLTSTLIYHNNGCNYSAVTLSGKSSSYLPYANSAQGSIVGYDKVTVVETNKGKANGSTAFYYDNQVESVGSQNSAFFGTIPNIRHTSNGNLLRKKVFTASGQLVSEELNTYAKQLQTQIPALAFRQSLEGVVARIGMTDVDISCASYQANEKFNIPSDRNVLNKSIVTNYSSNSAASLASVATNEFDTLSHLQISKTTLINSRKDTSAEAYTYTSNASWVPHEVVNEKHIYTPVAKTKTINRKIVSYDKEWYKFYPSTNVAVVNKVESSVRDNPLETVTEINKFDGIGNPVTVKNRERIFTTYQWGYNNQYPIAKVFNSLDSNYNSIGYAGANIYIGPTGHLSPNPASATFVQEREGPMTLSLPNSVPVGASVSGTVQITGPSNRTEYFSCNPSTGTCTGSSIVYPYMPAGTYTITVSGSGSFDSYTFGVGGSVAFQSVGNEKQFFYENFEENPSVNVIAGSAHTGTRYWNGNEAYRPSFPSSGRKYRIQWWGLSAGKWTFHQEPLTWATELTGPVDDVRIFPVDAKMYTYTYAPLVGMTSETDPTGKTTIYEYDGFGRLKQVKDDKGNILRRICYNYAGQVVNCN